MPHEGHWVPRGWSWTRGASPGVPVHALGNDTGRLLICSLLELCTLPILQRKNLRLREVGSLSGAWNQRQTEQSHTQEAFRSARMAWASSTPSPKGPSDHSLLPSQRPRCCHVWPVYGGEKKHPLSKNHSRLPASIPARCTNPGLSRETWPGGYRRLLHRCL